jgi:beta-glucanase (GH16 family)
MSRVLQGAMLSLIVAIMWGLFFDLLMARVTSHNVLSASTQDHRRWNLLWNDEFAGPAKAGVDVEEWQYATGTQYSCPTCPKNWGTGEIEVMTDSTNNTYLDGFGHLVIRPLKDQKDRWTSGRIETKRSDFHAQEGGVLAVEASLQLPDIAGFEGAGYWPAVWLLGDSYRENHLWPRTGEIDLLESVNGRDAIFAAFHCGSLPNGPCNEPTGIGSGPIACLACRDSFHVYRVELDRSVAPNEIRWYFDGKKYFQVTSDQVDITTWQHATNHGFFLIINVSVGGGFPEAFGGGPTPQTRSGAPMLIDYVRIYTR